MDRLQWFPSTRHSAPLNFYLISFYPLRKLCSLLYNSMMEFLFLPLVIQVRYYFSLGDQQCEDFTLVSFALNLQLAGFS